MPSLHNWHSFMSLFVQRLYYCVQEGIQFDTTLNFIFERRLPWPNATSDPRSSRCRFVVCRDFLLSISFHLSLFTYLGDRGRDCVVLVVVKDKQRIDWITVNRFHVRLYWMLVNPSELEQYKLGMIHIGLLTERGTVDPSWRNFENPYLDVVNLLLLYLLNKVSLPGLDSLGKGFVLSCHKVYLYAMNLF